MDRLLRAWKKDTYSERGYLNSTKEKLPVCHAFWAERLERSHRTALVGFFYYSYF